MAAGLDTGAVTPATTIPILEKSASVVSQFKTLMAVPTGADMTAVRKIFKLVDHFVVQQTGNEAFITMSRILALVIRRTNYPMNIVIFLH